jgi:SAM-dependent methyltransferase
MSDTPHCAFCGHGDAEKLKITSRSQLLAQYRNLHGLSFPPQVLESNFSFSNITTFRCRKCETIFYDPSIIGDAAFYDHLSSNISWYHSTKRWEYPIAAELLRKENPKLFLEVGCGAGHFLRLARSHGYEGHGSELERRHVDSLRGEGFCILTELERGLSQYDAVFMFQVLEHLADPYVFLKLLIPHVKPGGMVVVSTPVTPSCVSLALPPFALPPHHQWLPSIRAFNCLSERLGLVCDAVMCDPPDAGQVTYAIRKSCGLLPYSPNLARYWARLGQWGLRLATVLRCEWARVGHTGMAVLRKPAAAH